MTPSKKIQLRLIGSPLRAFQWAQDEHRTLSLSPHTKRGGAAQKAAVLYQVLNKQVPVPVPVPVVQVPVQVSVR